MNQYSMGLTVVTLAALGICAVYADLLARRICDFLLIGRNQERLDDLSKEIASETVDEMLVVMPGATATNFWNTAGPTIGQLPQKIASPFGDW
jgi:NADP-dependent 3-hydroxy acid dehydrogenase YdfG